MFGRIPRDVLRALRALATAALAVGCGAAPSRAGETGASSRAEAPASTDVLDAAAHALVRNGCASAIEGPAADGVAAIPAYRAPEGSNAGAFDVVVYTAHPDDEAMYVGGTMARLVRAGRSVAFVVMSHGEGGRLLERSPTGAKIERRDHSRAHVASVRDREIADAASRVPVAFAHLYPAAANADAAWTTSCSEAMATWNDTLPGGVGGTLRALVSDIRARRPRVVITLDARNDPQASEHGHHKAIGVLAAAAARLAADPQVGVGGRPHVVEELLTAAPRGAKPDVRVPIDVSARIAILGAYGSQFLAEELAKDDVAQRPTDDFLRSWRAAGAPVTKSGSRLLDLVGSEPPSQ